MSGSAAAGATVAVPEHRLIAAGSPRFRPLADEVWTDDEALDATDADVFAAASYHYARIAAGPFTGEDGQTVLDVLTDSALRPLLVRHMRSELAEELLDAFVNGFTAGLLR